MVAVQLLDALAARDPVRALMTARTHILNGIIRARNAGEARKG